MKLPRHVAIIMDGNGRWAKQRLMPRVAGHQQGAESVRAIVTYCGKKKIKVLTLFAFSSENWRRPQSEVSFLLGLFLKSLRTEIQTLHKNNVRLKVIGEKSKLAGELQEAITKAEQLTESNTGLHLNIALNYGGRWDILQAVQKISQKALDKEIKPSDISEAYFQSYLSLGDCPEPDLLIRTGGEHRISNFLLWDFAYTELYFTDTLWPDFRETHFEEALNDFALRQRRFGYIDEQLEDKYLAE